MLCLQKMKHQIDYSETIDGLEYTIVTEDYFKPVLDLFFDVFVKDEPIQKSIGTYPRRHQKVQDMVLDILKDGTSLMVIDPANNNKVVGLRLAFTVTRDQVEPKLGYEKYRKEHDFAWAVIWDVTDQTTHPSNIFEKYPEVTKIYDMFCLCTHQDYRGKGLGTEMVKQSWKMAKKAGCDASAVWASSNYSRKIFVNLGMITMHQIAWNDLIYEGEVAFKNVDSDCITSHFIKL